MSQTASIWFTCKLLWTLTMVWVKYRIAAWKRSQFSSWHFRFWVMAKSVFQNVSMKLHNSLHSLLWRFKDWTWPLCYVRLSLCEQPVLDWYQRRSISFLHTYLIMFLMNLTIVFKQVCICQQNHSHEGILLFRAQLF